MRWSSPRGVASRGAGRSPSASSRGCWGSWPYWPPYRRTTWCLTAGRSDHSVPSWPQPPCLTRATSRFIALAPCTVSGTPTRLRDPAEEATVQAALPSRLQGRAGRGGLRRARGRCLPAATGTAAAALVSWRQFDAVCVSEAESGRIGIQNVKKHQRKLNRYPAPRRGGGRFCPLLDFLNSSKTAANIRSKLPVP